MQTIQIYQGSRLRYFWRQRDYQFNYEVVNPALVEAIGKAIRLQEDIETR